MPKMDRIDEVVEAALVDYLECCDAGEVVNKEEFLCKYPNAADQLRAFFDMEDQVDLAVAGNSIKATDFPGTRCPPWPLPPRFTYVTRLGQGGMGVVVGAIQRDLNRKVA